MVIGLCCVYPAEHCREKEDVMRFFPTIAASAMTVLAFGLVVPAHADDWRGDRGRRDEGWRGEGWRGERHEHEWREREWRERQAYRAPYVYSQPYGYYPRPVYVPPPPVYWNVAWCSSDPTGSASAPTSPRPASPPYDCSPRTSAPSIPSCRLSRKPPATRSGLAPRRLSAGSSR